MAVILGKTGMLAHMMHKVMPDARVLGRPEMDATHKIRRTAFRELDDRIINCIGMIKPYCTDVKSAIKVNSLFPYQLPKGSIQIATDCVYSGDKGNYVETDPHDALDVYGKTKSLGEAPHINNLRCSIIGPELKRHLSLLDWFLSQEGVVNGYIDHWWNGLTTYHFAKILKGVIDNNIELPQIQHIVPADSVTKAELLEIISDVYGHDVKIKKIKSPQPTDRTLSTSNRKLNRELWAAAGYDYPPTIKQMVKELHEVSYDSGNKT